MGGRFLLNEYASPYGIRIFSTTVRAKINPVNNAQDSGICNAWIGKNVRTAKNDLETFHTKRPNLLTRAREAPLSIGGLGLRRAQRLAHHLRDVARRQALREPRREPRRRGQVLSQPARGGHTWWKKTHRCSKDEVQKMS